jgi:hypothetical protein
MGADAGDAECCRVAAVHVSGREEEEVDGVEVARRARRGRKERGEGER